MNCVCLEIGEALQSCLRGNQGQNIPFSPPKCRKIPTPFYAKSQCLSPDYNLLEKNLIINHILMSIIWYFIPLMSVHISGLFSLRSLKVHWYLVFIKSPESGFSTCIISSTMFWKQVISLLSNPILQYMLYIEILWLVAVFKILVLFYFLMISLLGFPLWFSSSTYPLHSRVI